LAALTCLGARKVQNDKKEDRFVVKAGRVYFRSRWLGLRRLRPPLRSYRFRENSLGSGANGVVFLAEHKYLGQPHVVKLYFPGAQVHARALLEAQKNANATLREAVAQVHDAGLFLFPFRIPYVVMEKVPSFHTLGSWLQGRDADWDQALTAMSRRRLGDKDYNDRGPAWEGARRRDVLSESIDLGTGLLRTVLLIHDQRIIHGDLNPGNILIMEPDVSQAVNIPSLRRRGGSDEPGGTSENPYLNPRADRKEPGTINSVPVRIIDLGSSQLDGTERQIGVMRESWFLVDDLRKVMKPWFEGKSGLAKAWLKLEQTKDKSGVQTYEDMNGETADPHHLAGDLLRLLCVANLLLGHTHSMRDRTTDRPALSLRLDSTDLAELRELMVDSLAAFRSDLIDGETLMALNKLPYRGVESYVNWHAVLTYFENEHPGLKRSLISLSDIRS
jgi:hypothetical protein